MKNVDLDLVDAFAFGKIDRKEFLQRNDCTLNFTELIELSLLCKIEGNNRRFEVLLWHVPKQLSSQEKEIFYRWLLLEDWHQAHEEVVGAFQYSFNHTPENIAYIRWAIEHVPNYLSGKDVKASYLRKCMYAIAAQAQPAASSALQELQGSADELISKLAGDQLAKWAGHEESENHKS
jgi:hypothetical protein